MREKKRDTGRVVQPSSLDGQWTDCRGTYLWSDKSPENMRNLLERMTDAVIVPDLNVQAASTYGGTVQIGSEILTVWFKQETAPGPRYLYCVMVKRTSPCRWVTQTQFVKTAKQIFTSWFSTFKIPDKSDFISDAEISSETRADVSPPDVFFLFHAAQLENTSAAHDFPQGIHFKRYKGRRSDLIFDGKSFVSEANDHQLIASVRIFLEWNSRHAQDDSIHSHNDSWRIIINQLVTQHVDA